MKWIFLLITVLFLTGCAAADAGNAFPQDEAGICAAQILKFSPTVEDEKSKHLLGFSILTIDGKNNAMPFSDPRVGYIKTPATISLTEGTYRVSVGGVGWKPSSVGPIRYNVLMEVGDEFFCMNKYGEEIVVEIGNSSVKAYVADSWTPDNSGSVILTFDGPESKTLSVDGKINTILLSDQNPLAYISLNGGGYTVELGGEGYKLSPDDYRRFNAFFIADGYYYAINGFGSKMPFTKFNDGSIGGFIPDENFQDNFGNVTLSFTQSFHYYPMTTTLGQITELTVIAKLTEISMNIGDPVQWYITTPGQETITGESDTLKCYLAGGLYDTAYYDFPENGTYRIRVEFPGYTQYAEWDVEVTSPPIPSFTHTTTGLTASFTSTSHDPDGYITSHHWNFADGTTSTAQNPTHTYSTTADYPVTLTVADNDGYKASITKTISVTGSTITKVIHPSDIPHGTELTVRINTDLETDITLDLDTFHQTIYGTDVTFNIDTTTLTTGEHTLTATAGSDTYSDSIIIYNPAIYQAITKGLDDLGTCSKDEMREISGKTGLTLTNHIYTILLGVELEEDVTVEDMLNNLRSQLGDVSEEVTTQLETFKTILILTDPSTGSEVDDLDPALNTIANIKNAINEVNEMVTDGNIVGSINEYVTKPAVYTAICADEETLIDTRTHITKSGLDPYYTRDQLDETNEILSIGKEAIANTDGEQIYRLYIGTVLGHEISVKPTLDHLAEKQIESINPPDDMCFYDACIPGKYNPVWVYHLTVADAESLLTIPASIGWIDATPEDEIVQPIQPRVAPAVYAVVKAVKAYMKYVDMLEKFSPWLIDGGMIISTDLLAKEVDEEHNDVIDAIQDIIQSPDKYNIKSPALANGGLYVPKGNILITTSPDGKIRNFKYTRSDSTFSIPVNKRIISLNTGWSESFKSETQNISVSIAANRSGYNVGEIVNLSVNISSDTYIEDAMLWIFIPEANTIIKDILNITVGDISRNYNFTICNETCHVPRVFLTDFETILAQNYTSFGVGEHSREAGIITIDCDGFYDPGVVDLNVTVHNPGTITLNSRLEYYGSHPDLTGSIDIPVLQAGKQMIEHLTFDLGVPGVYEMYFVLNSSSSDNGTLDYNTARFTVTAYDTLLAFPSTDKPVYSTGEEVNIAVTVKNVTLDVVSFPYSLSTTTPSGNVTGFESFVPEHNGTYVVKASPVAEGYCVVEGETLFIVERQSSLVIETQTVDNITTIKVETELGGAVEGADVVVNGYALKTDEYGEVGFSSFNVSQLLIQAEKFGFNPAVVLVNLKVFKGDLNGDGEITSEDVDMALDVVFAGEYVIEADVDGNGCVNILDVRMIMQAAAGRIEI